MRRLSAPSRRLLLCLAFAAAAGAGTWLHLDRERRRLEAGLPLSTVLVARRYIPAGEPVSPDWVEERRMPTAYLQPTAIADRAELRTGDAALRSRVGLLKGEQLTRSKLESPSARLGLAWALPAGGRALSLRLPVERAAGGLVLPGDVVDLLSVDRSAGKAGGARLLAAGVRIVAVQDRVWDPGSPTAPPAPPADGVVISLLVTPESAARVAEASERESIHLALRSPLAGGR